MRNGRWRLHVRRRRQWEVWWWRWVWRKRGGGAGRAAGGGELRVEEAPMISGSHRRHPRASGLTGGFEPLATDPRCCPPTDLRLALTLRALSCLVLASASASRALRAWCTFSSSPSRAVTLALTCAVDRGVQWSTRRGGSHTQSAPGRQKGPGAKGTLPMRLLNRSKGSYFVSVSQPLSRPFFLLFAALCSD